VIMVDSSVWIDYFLGHPTIQADKLDSLLGTRLLSVGDLILAEVLQGFSSDKDYNHAKKILLATRVVELGGAEIAIQAAINFRALRRTGVTVRKTIDTIIATYCIENDCELLHRDRDFEPFVEHLGLQSVCAMQDDS
jgi:predicted nucleic acid-binding protein